VNTQTEPGNKKNATILSLLSEGHSSEKILADHPEYDQSDIFAVAEKALPSRDRFRPLNPSIDNLLSSHPRALAVWSEDEDSHLKKMRHDGFTIFEISRMLKRPPSAIYSRMQELGVIH